MGRCYGLSGSPEPSALQLRFRGSGSFARGAQSAQLVPLQAQFHHHPSTLLAHERLQISHAVSPPSTARYAWPSLFLSTNPQIRHCVGAKEWRLVPIAASQSAPIESDRHAPTPVSIPSSTDLFYRPSPRMPFLDRYWQVLTRGSINPAAIAASVVLKSLSSTLSEAIERDTDPPYGTIPHPSHAGGCTAGGENKSTSTIIAWASTNTWLMLTKEMMIPATI